MRVAELEVRNFRSIEHLKLEGLGRAVVLYGRNGSGKSNVIAALSAATRLLALLAGQGVPESAASAVGAADAIQPGDFRVQGDGSIALGVVLDATEQAPLLHVDGQALVRLEFRVISELRAPGAPVGWCSLLSGRIAGRDAEVDLLPLLRHDESAFSLLGRDAGATTGQVPSFKDLTDPRRRERLAAAANVVRSFLTTQLHGPFFRVVRDIRHLGGESAPGRRVGDVGALLASGDLKGAFAAAHQHENPAVRDRFGRLRSLLSGEPLRLPEFDPVRTTDGTVDVQARVSGGGAVSIDLSGLGVLQLFYIVGSIALAPAVSVAVEEPEAHLHAPTSGRALRGLLLSTLDGPEPLLQQLFVATHSNLFDLDPCGYFHVELDSSGATRVERRAELASIDRDHLWEPGPARHALEDVMRVLPPESVVAHHPDGRPVTAQQMLSSLRAQDDVARSFCRDVVGAAVRAVRLRPKSVS